MKNFPKIALAATIGGAVAAFVGYAFYFDRKRRQDREFRRKIKVSPVVEPEPIEEPTKTESYDENLYEQNNADMTSFSPLIDLSVDEIYARPLAERQQIFQDLLIAGETLITSGSVEAVNLGVEYLYKSLSLVPSPAELLVLLQKTLSPVIFGKILEKINSVANTKIDEYYTSASQKINSGGRIAFCPDIRKSVSGTGNSSKRHQKQASHSLASAAYFLTAQRTVSAGEILFDELPEECFCVANDHESCDYCGIKSTDRYSCPKCKTCFCSESCFQLSSATYHQYFCGKNIEKLLSDPFAILVAKFVGFMLTQELSGTKSAASSFYHFEFFPKPEILNVFSQGPSELVDSFLKVCQSELAEVAALQKLFSEFNAGMAEFLSNERYISLKYILRHNAYSVLASSDAAAEAGCRVVQLNADFSAKNNSKIIDKSVYLFNWMSHLRHSCTPNAKIEVFTSEAGKSAKSKVGFRVVALKTVVAGESLSICYNNNHKQLLEAFGRECCSKAATCKSSM